MSDNREKRLSITVGDLDFQSTLTEKERNYIHGGNNWISKFSRETTLKSLHNLGWTLDEVDLMPEEEQEKIWDEANRCWNNQCWDDAKFTKPGGENGEKNIAEKIVIKL